MQDFINKNFWNFVVTLVAISMSWAVLNTRLAAVEAKAQEAQAEINKYSVLVERVIKLEEGRQINADNIKEIKEDIKDLKAHFNLR